MISDIENVIMIQEELVKPEVNYDKKTDIRDITI